YLAPQSSVIAGAEVILLDGERSRDVQSASAQGLAPLRGVGTGGYRLRVLAPGFSPQELGVSHERSEITIKLHLATAAETVVVTGTRNPVPEEEAGASVSTLEGDQLSLMNPVSAAEALRFLPGAVVNTQGERGGLASLFVRGGDSRYNKFIIDGVSINDPGGTVDFGVVPLHQTERREYGRGAQSTPQ